MLAVVFFQFISGIAELVMPARLMACLSLLPNYTRFDSTTVVSVFGLA